MLHWLIYSHVPGHSQDCPGKGIMCTTPFRNISCCPGKHLRQYIRLCAICVPWSKPPIYDCSGTKSCPELSWAISWINLLPPTDPLSLSYPSFLSEDGVMLSTHISRETVCEPHIIVYNIIGHSAGVADSQHYLGRPIPCTVSES